MAESDLSTPCLDGAPDSRRDAARHEAGHVLLAHVGDVAISSVRVSDAGTGKVLPVGDVTDAPRSWLLTAIAGTVAQAANLDGPSPHVDSDDGKLAYAAALILGDAYFEAVQAARLEVVKTLAAHRCHHTLLSEFLCCHHNTTIEWIDIAHEADAIFASCRES